ncbi:MAG TPA: succinate dehydrogenase cytochrome b subunit [Pontiella sp.]
MNITKTLFSSIGQKLLIATSGLIMFLLFLIPHMGGNILFLFGADVFNSYAHHLHELVPVVIGIEVLMLASITLHMIMAIRVSISNSKAHGKRLTQKSTKERSLAARLMPVSGGMIFIFIVKHLADFKLYDKTMTTLHGVETYDVYAMVLSRFQNDPVHLLFYVGFMVAVGLHLSHALQSSLQTYGLFVPRTGSRIKLASAVVAWGMAAIFAIIPIVAFTR